MVSSKHGMAIERGTGGTGIGQRRQSFWFRPTLLSFESVKYSVKYFILTLNYEIKMARL